MGPPWRKMSGRGTLDGGPIWRKLSIHGGPITTDVKVNETKGKNSPAIVVIKDINRSLSFFIRLAKDKFVNMHDDFMRSLEIFVLIHHVLNIQLPNDLIEFFNFFNFMANIENLSAENRLFEKLCQTHNKNLVFIYFNFNYVQHNEIKQYYVSKG